MALKHANNEMDEVFLQNENLRTQRYIVAHSSSMKIYKNNSSSIKYGLSELSNDKTYLETELPARKRLKSEAELLDTMKYPNKTCKVLVNDDFSNVICEEKYSSEIPNILSNEQGFENDPPQKELIRSDLYAEVNTQSESFALKSDTYSHFQNTLVNKMKLDSNESTICTFERKSENHDFGSNLENDYLLGNFDDDKISNRDTDNEIEFDDEVNKCCKLLDLDVPRMAAVSTTGTKITNNNYDNKIFENSQIHKCEISNHINKSLDALNPQSTKLEGNSKTMSNDINLQTISLDKKLKMQNELLIKNEKGYKGNLEFKHGINSVSYSEVASNSLLTTFNENRIDINDKLFHDEISVNAEDASLESESRDNNKNNSTLKINNVLNFNSTSVGEPIIFNSDRIQNYNSKSKHLNLTIEDTLNSDILKLKGTNQNIYQDHFNVNKDEIDMSSSVDDSGDMLSLYVESDIDFDETEEEISKTNLSESAILAQTSENNMTVFHTSPAHDNKSYSYIDDKVKKEDNLILNENIDPVDVNRQMGEKNFESHILYGVSNDCSENKNDFDIKVGESFVSDYEISLLVDTDSILSEESLDSEYEISLLEDDINDVESQNDLHENKSDSNVDSDYLSISAEKDGKVANKEFFDSEYKLFSLEKDRNYENDLHENKLDSNIGSKDLPNDNEKNEKTTNNVHISEKKIISKNKIDLKSISERYTASSTEENIPSNFLKNDNTADKIVSELKISADKEEMQTFSKIKSSENTNKKIEQDFRFITDGKKIPRLGKPTTLRSEKSDGTKKEPSENTNDSHFLLKPKINNESRTSNKVILNSNKIKNSEEKSVVVNKIRHLADGACTNIATRVKSEKMKLYANDVGESKKYINEFQVSNKEVLNSKMNEISRSEEKVLIAIKNKQLPESVFTDKATPEKTVKTDLSVSANGESKQNAKDIIPDYYEEEKEDLINPGWNKIKELSTDEERYCQVRDCWKSKNIPNPFKNLTYYSYRKRNIKHEDNTHQKRQHKRHATGNLNDNDAKRSRSCTYIFDDRIKSIEKEKEIKTKTLDDKMSHEVKRLNELHHQEETGINHFYGYSFDSRRQFELSNLWRDYQLRVQSVSDEYKQQIHNCHDQYTSEINKLKNNRNEVLQFYSFYKGLNKDEYEDPTILTNAQMQELEEIENIYNQMDLHYK